MGAARWWFGRTGQPARGGGTLTHPATHIFFGARIIVRLPCCIGGGEGGGGGKVATRAASLKKLARCRCNGASDLYARVHDSNGQLMRLTYCHYVTWVHYALALKTGGEGVEITI